MSHTIIGPRGHETAGFSLPSPSKQGCRAEIQIFPLEPMDVYNNDGAQEVMVFSLNYLFSSGVFCTRHFL